MEPLMTEAVGRITYGPQEPTSFMLSDNYGPTDNAANLSRTARIRLAGNAVVGPQARLMLQRGLTATNDTRGNLR